MPTQFQVVNQAVLQSWLGHLDRLGGVNPVDSAHKGPDDGKRTVNSGQEQARDKNRPAEPEGHTEKVIEHDLNEQYAEKPDNER